jgi:hypothetical protein
LEWGIFFGQEVENERRGVFGKMNILLNLIFRELVEILRIF